MATAVAASSIGNALEWHDFPIHGWFAAAIAKRFVPTGNEWVSLPPALGTFAIPFPMRPPGAALACLARRMRAARA